MDPNVDTTWEPTRSAEDIEGWPWLRFSARIVEAIAGSRNTAIVSIPAPLASPECLLNEFPEEEAFLWDKCGEFSATGRGVAHRIRTTGSNRIAEAKVMAEALWERVVSVAPPDCNPPEPRLYGGLSFTPTVSQGAVWSDFGDLDFVLPECAYVRTRSEAWLQCALVGPQLKTARQRQRLLEQLERTLSLLACRDALEPKEPVCGPAHMLHDGDPADWISRVEAAREKITSGRLEKVVLSRQSIVECDQWAWLQALYRLRTEESSSTRFAFRFGDSTFLGRTPECLVRKSGGEFETEAVAGTAVLSDDASGHLLADAKERHEHNFVVDHIVRKLTSRASKIICGPQPEVRRLAYLQHLVTPIEGKLDSSAHVLDLVECLHPTPAVAGTPYSNAIRWLLENEDHERGWYCGPIGWFDRRGDGEFNVALRSALFTENRAYVYAGAGIVADSVASQEYSETQQKMIPILRALGIDCEQR